MTLLPGQQLGPYEILALLGAGGMGEVYRARDLRLGRTVAIKVLANPDPDARRRFIQEARAASALNHPGIVTVYDVGPVGEGEYIAMEFVEGKTLRQLLDASGRLELNPVLDFGQHVASALARAHAAGIVHRDLKPENLMQRSDGLVKVLDFGLAKLLDGGGVALGDPQARTVDLVRTAAVATESGVISGTIAYMSPEQAQGQALDHRSDIFSLGTVLYEALLGRRPFGRAGDGIVDTLHAVVHDAPMPLRAIRPELPRELEEILGKCLEKEPAERYQHAGDLEVDLRRLRRRAAAGSTPPTAAPESARRPPPGARRAWAWAAALVVSTGLAAVAGARWAARETAPPDATKLTRITSYDGREEEPSFSPDGRQVAFVREVPGRARQIYVRQIAGGDAVQVTRDERYKAAPSYSPDGALLLYAAGDVAPKATELWLVPALGGSARRVVDRAESGGWSPDGRRIVYASEHALYSADAGGGDVRTLVQGDEGAGMLSNPAWSPDGRWLAYVRLAQDFSSFPTLWMAHADGSAPRLLAGVVPEGRLAWMPDSKRIVFANDGNIWIGDVEGEARRRLTLMFGTSWFVSPAVSRDGSRIVASAHTITSHLWIAPTGLDARANAEAARQVTSGANEYLPAWSPDGTSINYFADASGSGQRWLADVEASASAPVLVHERQLTFGSPAGVASWSPDGLRFALHGLGGNGEVLVMDRDGGNRRKIGPEGATNGEPTWSPDGAAIIFRSNSGGRYALWTAPAAGGAAVPFTDFDCSWPDGSPAADAIACVAENPSRIVVLDAKGRQASSFEIGEQVTGLPRWTNDGKWIGLAVSERGSDNIWLYSRDGGERRKLTDFAAGHAIIGLSFSPDGRHVVFDRRDERSDLAMLEGL